VTEEKLDTFMTNCSFCGRSVNRIWLTIGPMVSICMTCVNQSAEVMSALEPPPCVDCGWIHCDCSEEEE
jgi:NMD protein affecting ribosome stability and mRNA decay